MTEMPTLLPSEDVGTATTTRPSKPAALHIICERDVGLFSLIQQVIANVAYAIHEGRVPIVFFGRRCSYWTPNGYHGRDSVWEYYFEPVVLEYPVRAIPEHIKRSVENKRLGNMEFGYFTDNGTFITRNFGEHLLFRGKALFIPHEFDDPGEELRRAASRVISQHIRVRDEIRERAQEFYDRNMQHRPHIGVHLRGTDALVDKSRFRWGPLIDLARYRRHIEDFLKTCPEAGIFVASDADSLLQKMRDVFGDRVVATDAVRNQGESLAGKGPTGARMPAHLTVDKDVAARSGEEAVIDYLLLCRCNALVHNGSSVARTVLLTLPEMPAWNTILPSYFGRQAFYFVRTVKSVSRWVPPPVRKRWQHRMSVVQDTIAGQPITSWLPLLRRRWLKSQKNRRDRGRSRSSGPGGAFTS